MWSIQKNSRAFGLLEVIVAAALGLMVAAMAAGILLPAVRHQARGAAQADLHRLAASGLSWLRRDLASTGTGGVTVFPKHIVIQPLGGVTPDGRLTWETFLVVYALQEGRLTRDTVELPEDTLLDRPAAVQAGWVSQTGGRAVSAGVTDLDFELTGSLVHMAVEVASSSHPELPPYRARETFTLRSGS